ncbi:MAG: transcription-repair coupling factor [Armatimonadota bacterium]|nr:transcription-repair coupling factor [Armatimonadota bacterium]
MALAGLLPLLQRQQEYNKVLQQLHSSRGPMILGLVGAEKAYLLASLFVDLSLPASASCLVITPTRADAERFGEDLLVFLPHLEEQTRLFPSWEILPYDEAPPSVEVLGERMSILHDLASGRGLVILAPISSVLQKVPYPGTLSAFQLVLKTGTSISREAIVAFLVAGGYERMEQVVARGQFAVRGGIVDIFSPQMALPIRVELFGDEVEQIRSFDPASQRSIEVLHEATILPAGEQIITEAEGNLLDYLDDAAVIVLDEPIEVKRQADDLISRMGEARLRAEETGRIVYLPPALEWKELEGLLARRRRITFSFSYPQEGDPESITFAIGGVETFAGQTRLLSRRLEEWRREGRRVVLASGQAKRFCELLQGTGVPVDFAESLPTPPAPSQIVAVPSPLSRGFRLEDLVVVTDSEVLGWRRHRRRRARVVREGTPLTTWLDLHEGDYVVHIHHGIGIYRGLVHLSVDGVERDYLLIEYAQGDRLYVPVDQINLVQRYIGVEGMEPQIHRLGGADWEREKRRVREATQELARKLLELYASRETARGFAFSPDTPWQHELEASFEYEETPDQQRAIEEVKRDMETPKPMDRLICGDVGYGKTEVAVRAAFKAVMDGKQVAVLVPTTILAQQHYTVFSQRFAPYPIKVEVLSRFRSQQEQRRILQELRAGIVDVIIGTHRLLQPDVQFKDLGLVIIDEEQRFGVAQKERLKELRREVDVLTLTATPIPRTLYMSLVGLRDISIIETPPDSRQPIRTVVAAWEDAMVAEAIRRELSRGGQVYVVSNRVETIDRTARHIQRLVPEARVAVAHGQMSEERLERIMLDFIGGRYDVLICTTIVEIGLDIPRVNTIIVENAHMMGLSQLYQLRGRVGRSDRQAYAYLLYPKGVRLTPEAYKRLEALQEFVELGSGFKLAMRDLEIRGAGNLLGPEQHGHLAAVGFDLYCRLLDEAIRQLRGEIVEEAPDPVIELRVDAYIPQFYIPDETQRLTAYRKLSTARTLEEVEEVASELRDRYGDLPGPVRNLLEIVRLKVLARQAGVASVGREGAHLVLRFPTEPPIHEHGQRLLDQALRGRATLHPKAIVLRTEGRSFQEDARWLREALETLIRIESLAHPRHAHSGFLGASGPMERARFGHGAFPADQRAR